MLIYTTTRTIPNAQTADRQIVRRPCLRPEVPKETERDPSPIGTRSRPYPAGSAALSPGGSAAAARAGFQRASKPAHAGDGVRLSCKSCQLRGLHQTWFPERIQGGASAKRDSPASGRGFEPAEEGSRRARAAGGKPRRSTR